MEATIKEKQDLCAKLLISWICREQRGEDMTKHTEEAANLFTSRMIMKKFEVFDINIILPDELLFILYLCVDSGPGMFQIVLKDLLNSIKNRKGLISPGYVITSEDFGLCFMTDFPIMDIKYIENKYITLWDGQKKERKHKFDSDNLCDTVEWWKEVME